VGARYGKGYATCRTPMDGARRRRLRSRAAAGAFSRRRSSDLVMLVMNDRGMEHLLSSKFKLGAEASAAAGPVGRQAEANTDWKCARGA